MARQLLHDDVQHVASMPEMTSFEQSYEWLCKSAAGVFQRAVARYGLDVVLGDLMGQPVND